MSFFTTDVQKVQNQHELITKLTDQAVNKPAEFRQLSSDAQKTAQTAAEVADTVIKKLEIERKNRQTEIDALNKAWGLLQDKVDPKAARSNQENRKAASDRISEIDQELPVAQKLQEKASYILNLPKALADARIEESKKLDAQITALKKIATYPEKIDLTTINGIMLQAEQSQSSWAPNMLNPTYNRLSNASAALKKINKSMTAQEMTMANGLTAANALILGFEKNNEDLIKGSQKEIPKLETLLNIEKNILNQLKEVQSSIGETVSKLPNLIVQQNARITALNDLIKSQTSPQPAPSSSSSAAATAALVSVTPASSSAAPEEVVEPFDSKPAVSGVSPLLVAFGVMNAALFVFTAYNLRTDNGRKPLF